MGNLFYKEKLTGDGDIFIAGGVENMTRGPWIISKVSKAFGRDAQDRHGSIRLSKKR